MNIGIIEFPGTNCERETSMAVERAGMNAVAFMWNGDRALLRSFDGYILAGGFSYEDRSRSGIIAALDPIIPIIREQGELGKPVLGICNGAQVLVESGMVPNLSLTGSVPETALASNKRIAEGRVAGTGFYNAWVTLRFDFPDDSANPWYQGAFTSRFSPGECITIPAAHGEGRFVFPEEIRKQVIQLGLIPFKYADGDGAAAEVFPHNPNGSQLGAAALTNIPGNILAIMPHPERTAAGDKIFLSMADYIASSRSITLPPAPLAAPPPPDFPSPYHASEGAEEIIIRQVITDNQAVSVETTLRALGFEIAVQRHIHWEICLEPGISEDKRSRVMEKIHASGELYNSNKEKPVKAAQLPEGTTFLVREDDDVAGMNACQALKSWFGCREVVSVTKSVLWTLSSSSAIDPGDVLNTHIFMNPHSYKGYVYE